MEDFDKVRVGLFIQIIGVTLFAPYVLAWLRDLINWLAKHGSLLMAQGIKMNPVGGAWVAEHIFLFVTESMQTRRELAPIGLLLYIVVDVLIHGFMLFVFLSTFPLQISVFLWVPHWLKVISIIWYSYHFLMAFIMFFWDWFHLAETKVGKEIVTIFKSDSGVRKNIPSSSLGTFIEPSTLEIRSEHS